MAESPPPQFAAYPRGAYPGARPYGAADQLEALAEGYFGLSRAFLINVLLGIVLRIVLDGISTQLSRSFADDLDRAAVIILASYAAGLLAMAVAVGFLTFPSNRKIGKGCNWSPSGAAIASTLIGLNSALCCGIVGYALVQNRAVKEMAHYGVKPGFLAGRRFKAEVAAKVAQMRAATIPTLTPDR